MNTFFDVFEYESVEIMESKGEKYRIFHNVRLLKDCDGQTKGTQFETVTINIEIRGWNANEDQEINIYL
jgi:hypothetical protein